MTETHAGNGSTKVFDQLLNDISTADSSVVDSQTSAQDNIQTIHSGKSVTRKKSTSETTVKATTNWSASLMAKGQSTDVLKGLNELKDLQRQSLSSMNQIISTMTSAGTSYRRSKLSPLQIISDFLHISLHTNVDFCTLTIWISLILIQ